MSKHTPGPFHGVYPAFSRDKQEAHIEISNDSGLHHATNADMKLFAAAPEMLEALKVALSALEIDSTEFPTEIELVKQALAKAEG